MEAIGSNEERASGIFNLMGVLSLEFMMFPAAMLGQDEDIVKSPPQWYEVDGKNFSTLTLDGESNSYEFEPTTE
ncbi:MAG: hypothetical protein GX777_01575 [Fastidiosipila sp.]|nr:hypothetical protein [Fastidiosipila sp.]